MPLPQSDDPESLAPLNVQVTRSQKAWLEGQKSKRQVRTVAAVVRQIIAAAKDAEQSSERRAS